MAEPLFSLLAKPFADTGDKETIPTDTDPSGAASFSQGWGEDYERNPVDDPLAKRINRGMMNQLFYSITLGLRQYQLASYPQWSKAADNNSMPLSYPYGARVRYGGRVYASTVDDNNSEPSISETWVIDDPFDFNAHVASLSEVLAGLINNKIVTPKTFVQAHREQPFSYTKATGEPNALIAKFSPPVERLVQGTILYIQAAQSNTGNVTLKVEDLPAYPVLGVGGVQLPAGSLTPNGVMQVVFTGTGFISPNLSRASDQFFGITRLASKAETGLGESADIALTPKHTSAAVQSGAWTYATAVDADLENILVTLAPAPAETPSGFSFCFQMPANFASNMKVKVNGLPAAPLHWSSGAAVVSGQIAAGDAVHVIRIGGQWRVVNMQPASESRLGMLRVAELADLAAETGGDKAVNAATFGTGVRATALKGLSAGVDIPLAVTDTVIQAFAKLQAQLNQKGGLKTPNIWTQNNIFESGVLDIRAAIGASKVLAFNDVGGNPRGRVIAGTDNLLRLQTFAAGSKVGADLTFSGNLLAKDNSPSRRYINREEIASYEETAAMQTAEKYVTPSTLGAIVSGVEISELNGFAVYTISRKLRIVAGRAPSVGSSFRLNFPPNFFTRTPSSVEGLASSGGGDRVTSAYVTTSSYMVSTSWSSGHGQAGSNPSLNFAIFGWCA